jgi:hypothetical protein
MRRTDGVRTAHLRGLDEAGTLLFAGEPSAPAGDWEGEIALAGARLDRRSCGAPWLAAYAVAPSSPDRYQSLTFVATRAGAPGVAPFALRGLAYGSAGEALLVIGDGWHSAEANDDGEPFRWATKEARALVNVPPSGARLEVEGEVPRRVGGPAAIVVEAGDARASVSASGRFRLAHDLAGGPPRTVVLRSDRDFVPDDTQHNGDRRRLALKIERFELKAR